jgi:hypothetical protein
VTGDSPLDCRPGPKGQPKTVTRTTGQAPPESRVGVDLARAVLGELDSKAGGAVAESRSLAVRRVAGPGAAAGGDALAA